MTSCSLPQADKRGAITANLQAVKAAAELPANNYQGQGAAQGKPQGHLHLDGRVKNGVAGGGCSGEGARGAQDKTWPEKVGKGGLQGYSHTNVLLLSRTQVRKSQRCFAFQQLGRIQLISGITRIWTTPCGEPLHHPVKDLLPCAGHGNAPGSEFCNTSPMVWGQFLTE